MATSIEEQPRSSGSRLHRSNVIDDRMEEDPRRDYDQSRVEESDLRTAEKISTERQAPSDFPLPLVSNSEIPATPSITSIAPSLFTAPLHTSLASSASESPPVTTTTVVQYLPTPSRRQHLIRPPSSSHLSNPAATKRGHAAEKFKDTLVQTPPAFINEQSRLFLSEVQIHRNYIGVKWSSDPSQSLLADFSPESDDPNEKFKWTVAQNYKEIIAFEQTFGSRVILWKYALAKKIMVHCRGEEVEFGNVLVDAIEKYRRVCFGERSPVNSNKRSKYKYEYLNIFNRLNELSEIVGAGVVFLRGIKGVCDFGLTDYGSIVDFCRNLNDETKTKFELPYSLLEDL